MPKEWIYNCRDVNEEVPSGDVLQPAIQIGWDKGVGIASIMIDNGDSGVTILQPESIDRLISVLRRIKRQASGGSEANVI